MINDHHKCKYWIWLSSCRIDLITQLLRIQNIVQQRKILNVQSKWSISILYRAIYTQCLVCKLFSSPLISSSFDIHYDEIYLRNIWMINTTKINFFLFTLKSSKQHFGSFEICSHLFWSSIWLDLQFLII